MLARDGRNAGFLQARHAASRKGPIAQHSIPNGVSAALQFSPCAVFLLRISVDLKIKSYTERNHWEKSIWIDVIPDFLLLCQNIGLHSRIAGD